MQFLRAPPCNTQESPPGWSAATTSRIRGNSLSVTMREIARASEDVQVLHCFCIAIPVGNMSRGRGVQESLSLTRAGRGYSPPPPPTPWRTKHMHGNSSSEATMLGGQATTSRAVQVPPTPKLPPLYVGQQPFLWHGVWVNGNGAIRSPHTCSHCVICCCMANKQQRHIS